MRINNMELKNNGDALFIKISAPIEQGRNTIYKQDKTNTLYVQIYEENQDLYDELLPLWFAYFNELDENENDKPTKDEIINDLKRRISNQGKRSDMHFELIFCDNTLIGFSHFAVVLGGSQAGWGFIMEFYIVPEFRRKGYGKLFYKHIEKTLKNDGAENIFLTCDTITGEPFWIAMGYNDSGKIDPDNNLPVYIKNL